MSEFIWFGVGVVAGALVLVVTAFVLIASDKDEKWEGAEGLWRRL